MTCIVFLRFFLERQAGRSETTRAVATRGTDWNQGRKVRSQPVSRVLYGALRPATVIPLGPRLPAASSNLPGSGAGHAIAPLFGLAPDGVYRPRTSPPGECALTGDAPHRAARASCDARHYFTLTADPLKNCPSQGDLIGCRERHPPARDRWRYLSVALSVASRRPAVSRHPALRCPDFPLCRPHTATVRLASRPHYGRRVIPTPRESAGPPGRATFRGTDAARTRPARDPLPTVVSPRAPTGSPRRDPVPSGR